MGVHLAWPGCAELERSRGCGCGLARVLLLKLYIVKVHIFRHGL